jgi:hypothetical protein
VNLLTNLDYETEHRLIADSIAVMQAEINQMLGHSLPEPEPPSQPLKPEPVLMKVTDSRQPQWVNVGMGPYASAAAAQTLSDIDSILGQTKARDDCYSALHQWLNCHGSWGR